MRNNRSYHGPFHARRRNPSRHGAPRVSQPHEHARPQHPPVHAHPPPTPYVPHSHPIFATLLPEIQHAVMDEGYMTPTPIQEQAIPNLVAGRDVLGCAQTGTGKTAAFVLPMLQHLTANARTLTSKRPRTLILAPTRELAAQIGDSIRTYGRYLKLHHTVVFGGVGQRPQEVALGRGVEMLVATPGRLLDLMGQGHVSLASVEIFVLDEADRMLDMGFIPDVKRIIAALPQKRQSLFFSATLQPEVVALARTLVRDPVHITITPEEPAVDKIVQKIMFVDKDKKDDLLIKILSEAGMSRVIVFTQMKHIANRVCEKLEKAGISSSAIHGNKSQTARTEALRGFKTGQVRVLVATDIAARGIDVDGITHVINYQMPMEPETYVHRIGRTARAGADGDAISFCCAEDRDFLRAIEKLLRRSIPVDTGHGSHSETARNATGAAARPSPRGFRQQGRRDHSRKPHGGHGGHGGSHGGGGHRSRFKSAGHEHRGKRV